MLSSRMPMPILYVLCCLIQVEVIKKEHPWIPLQGFSSQYTFFFFWENFSPAVLPCWKGLSQIYLWGMITCLQVLYFCFFSTTHILTTWATSKGSLYLGHQGKGSLAGAEMKGEYKFVAFVCSFLNLIPFLSLKLKANKK